MKLAREQRRARDFAEKLCRNSVKDGKLPRLKLCRNCDLCCGWVGTRRMHQDVSSAFVLGPFGSSAFFFCSQLMVGASVVFMFCSDQAP